MQFRVPQFIDMEDKIIGPLTLKQFGYILGAGGFSFIIWTFIPIKFIALLFILPVVALFLSLAFLKINNRPFGDILENAFTYYTSSKIYTWKQPTPDTPEQQAQAVATQQGEQAIKDKAMEMAEAKADQNTLHDVALGLDVLDHANPSPSQLESTSLDNK